MVDRLSALRRRIGDAGESTMNTLWLLLALWIGAMMGFLAFALMAMARDSDRVESRMLARSMRTPARQRAR